MSIAKYADKVIDAINSEKVRNRDELNNLKIKLCEEFRIRDMPTNPDILVFAKNPTKKLKSLLSIKQTRTLSGIASVAVMTKPIACKHGKCTFCPGGPQSVFGDVPQSYTGNEPATMRGIANNYDSYLQTFTRLAQYVALSHNCEKVELIVMGGTFPSFPMEYQDEFITYSLKAMNDFGKLFYENEKIDFVKFNEFFEFPRNYGEKDVSRKIKEKIIALKGQSYLEQEQFINETSKIRNVAMCIETKPDWGLEKEINQMLKLGTTRVELGVQQLNDEILKETNRGHSLQETIGSTQLMKDSFLKIGYHIMPGLPKSNREKDILMFKELFENPDYMPDTLKIYPCMVMPGTPLYEQWKKGKFKAITTAEAAEMIAEGKKYIPKWCRVMRVQRDIPTKYAAAGSDSNNLRQLVEKEMKEKGIKCRCIRCREAGLKGTRYGIEIKEENLKLEKESYNSSRGKEIFISIEDKKNDLLLGFCRLRIPYKPFRKEITEKTAGIRELHVFGVSTPLGKKTEESVQHKGYGRQLVKEAERIAREEFGMRKIAVISGIGARQYYIQKLGYEKDGAYVSKII